MNALTWEQATDVDPMIRALDEANLDKARLSRLLGCAFAVQIWDKLSDKLGRPSIEIVERFVDGKADWADLRMEFLRIGGDSPPRGDRGRAIDQISVDVLMMFSISASQAGRIARNVLGIAKERQRKAVIADQIEVIRDIFANPYQPELFDPSWLTSPAKALAKDIHDNRAFEAMPILGDALEEAGCASAAILDHCRSKNHHVRGCWVVDGVLGLR